MLQEGVRQWPEAFQQSAPYAPDRFEPAWGCPDTSGFALVLQQLLFYEAPPSVFAAVVSHAAASKKPRPVFGGMFHPTDTFWTGYYVWFFPIAQMVMEGVERLQRRNSTRPDVLSLAVQHGQKDVVHVVSCCPSLAASE